MRSDNGGEYLNINQGRRLAELGIVHETSAPYFPQQNGVAERENRTLMEMARSMLYASKSKLPLSFWAEATAYAAYILNRIPSSRSNTSPFERWTGQKPKLSHLRVFGSRTFVHVPDAKRTKLEPKCVEGILVGFCESTKAYRVYIPSQRKVIVSLDVIIDETKGCDVLNSDHVPDDPVTNSLFDPFIHQTTTATTETPRTAAAENNEEESVGGDNEVLPLTANSRNDISATELPETTQEANEENLDFNGEEMEVDDPAQIDDDRPPLDQRINQDQEPGLRRSARLHNRRTRLTGLNGKLVNDEATIALTGEI